MENRRKKDLLDADYADGHGFFKDFSVRICEIRGIRVQNHGNFERARRFYHREELKLRASAVSHPPLCLKTSEVFKASEVWEATHGEPP